MNDESIIKTVRSYRDLVSYSYSPDGGIFKVEHDEITNANDVIYILPGDGTVKNISSSTGTGLTPEQQELLNDVEIYVPSFVNIPTSDEKQAIGDLSNIIFRDLSFENINYTTLVNVNYDVLRPNKAIVLGGNISINVLNSQSGDSGIIAITRSTGTETIILSGGNTIVFPATTGIPYPVSYLNINGNVIWSI